MAAAKKYLKRIALATLAAGTLCAGTLGVLSLNSVQKKIAVAVLKNAGIQAEIGEWDSDFFSDFRLRDITLKRGDEFEIQIPELQVHSSVIAQIFSPEISLRAEFKETNSLQIAGKSFALSVDELTLNNALGSRNRLAGTLIPQKKENPPQAKFEFESENRKTIYDFSLLGFLTGTRVARLNFNEIECRLDETGTWKIFDKSGRNSALSGAGKFHDGKLRGTVSARLDGERFKAFGIGENLPAWNAAAEIAVAADLASERCSLRHLFELRLAEPGGTFSGIPLLPEIRLKGNGKFNFENNTFSLETFFANMALAPDNAAPVVFAEISVPEELGFAYSQERGLKISAQGNASELALLKFNNVPISLANSFLARIPSLDNEKKLELTGTLNGAFALSQTDAGEFIFAGKEGLKVRDFSLKRADDIWFSGITANLPLVAFTRGNTAGIELKNAIAFGDFDRAFASANFSGIRDFSKKTTSVEASARIESAALTQQFFSGFFGGLSDKKIAANSELKAEISDDEIKVSALKFSVFEDDDASRTLLTANTGAFRFDAENPFVGLDGKQITLQANAFPLALIDPLARGKFFFAGTIDGEIAFIGDKSKIEFSTEKRGMTIRNFRMKNARKSVLLDGLSLRSVDNLVRVSRDASGKFHTEIGLKNARLKNSNDTRLASGDLYLNFHGKELLTLRSDISGDLGSIVRQPLFTPVSNLASGSIEIHGGWDAVNQTAKLEANLRDLRSRGPQSVEIDNLNLTLEHNAGANFAARIRAALDGNEHSSADLSFSKLDFNLRENKADFNADLFAEKIVVADLISLAEIFSPKKNLPPARTTQTKEQIVPATAPSVSQAAPTHVPAEKQAHASTEIPPAKTPPESNEKGNFEQATPAKNLPKTLSLPWKNIAGTLNFRILECVVPENRLQNISGSLNLAPERGELIVESDNFFDGSLKSKTVVETRHSSGTFFAKTKIAVKNSKIYKAIPALRAKDSSIVEGSFSVDLSAEAEAPKLSELKHCLSADAVLLGQNGNIRIFSADNKDLRNVGDLARIGGGVAELLGGFGGKKLRRITSSARRLQEYLSDFPYDVHEVRLSYRAGNPILCRKFLLQNELLKITGTGEIAYSEELPIGDAPLAIRARMDVRGELKEMMNTLGILKSAGPGTEDSDYSVGPEFNLTGTLNRLSDNLLETLLSSGSGLRF